MPRIQPRPAMLRLALAAAAGLLLVPIAGAQDRAPENPTHYGRDYRAPDLSPAALTELLWESCPDADRPPCLVTDPKTDSGQAHLIAAPAVHRKVGAALARLDADFANHRLRLDLVRVDAGGALELPTQLPASLRRTLDAHRAGLSGAGLVHLGTAHLTTENAASSFLVTAAGTFHVRVDIDQRAQSPDGPLRLELGLDHRAEKPESLPGAILRTSLGIAPGDSVLAGTTYAHQDGDRLLLLLTLEE